MDLNPLATRIICYHSPLSKIQMPPKEKKKKWPLGGLSHSLDYKGI